ncbi:MAG TPA: GNAT family N-acetyltransferase [Xanthomonadaceae bacterium]|nr:GNAT family N-acetyltransferase [Xanthomonadaceae bacterium]
MAAPPAFRVEQVDYAGALPGLRAVRERVFVQEHGLPAAVEKDELDPLSTHVLACDAQGTAVGTGRLTPERRIGRMAVLPQWRGRGVGSAVLAALLHEAQARGWREVALHAHGDAVAFYLRHGFAPVGDGFIEAGIAQQVMARPLGLRAIEDRDAARAAAGALIRCARRGLSVYTRDLDPGLFDDAGVLDALRGFATAGRGGEARFLLQDAAAPQRAHSPLLALAQRLPSAFLFREVTDPVDRAYPSAFIANDAGGFYFRALGHRFDGEADLHAPGRARQLRMAFDAVWERARPVGEYRALGL